MTVLIIEDNEIEMENLKILLSRLDTELEVSSTDSLQEGIKTANELKPHIIILDIQLECSNSLDHIEQLTYSPYIICSTLYSSHALQAFEVGVTDYLTKPITEEKLLRALNRIPSAPLSEILASSPDEKGCVFLKNGPKTEKIPLDQIYLIIADRDYTVVKNENGSEFVSTRRMREWKELLPVSKFSAIDRSTIVNTEVIVSYTSLGINRTSTITFSNGEKHQIGSTGLRRLKLFMTPSTED